MQDLPHPDQRPDQRRALARLIAQSLDLADTLGLDMVGISLNGALEQLIGATTLAPVTAH
ncbi:hypothetical protein [Sphingomonas mollis]|uniref:Uncharacterized protein n=1 Tax=Sphingomonas mollis TaxID=2795726 RepID=A0ABS0XRE8_9SPHN|nr:hypothetical protein [Sphingomonas sp. BT553]MBJ6122618.1 hypothetical protein [Sphingomonas sp. BT553]